ncbi:MAG: MBL fold metallo-hydrolase [Candidatus Doudnabacteria bacterium]|nr:MBL fold metallo-hydrolase [Candidatus Doudnabacteria bacterium]
MTITWFGLSSFKIVGKDLTLITDPFGKESGLAPVRGGADVVVCSNPQNPLSNNFSSISGEPFVITGPGEYDVKGAFIIGIASVSKESVASTIFSIEVEDIRIAFLGLTKQAPLTEQQKEALEGADMVLIPAGNKEALGFEDAAKIATQLEPFIVIPHSYKIAGLAGNFDKLDKFLQEMGGKHQELDKLTLKKKDLNGESTDLIVLTAQR